MWEYLAVDSRFKEVKWEVADCDKTLHFPFNRFAKVRKFTDHLKQVKETGMAVKD